MKTVQIGQKERCQPGLQISDATHQETKKKLLCSLPALTALPALTVLTALKSLTALIGLTTR